MGAHGRIQHIHNIHSTASGRVDDYTQKIGQSPTASFICERQIWTMPRPKFSLVHFLKQLMSTDQMEDVLQTHAVVCVAALNVAQINTQYNTPLKLIQKRLTCAHVIISSMAHLIPAPFIFPLKE